MNIYHDIGKSDGITALMQIFIMATVYMSLEACNSVIVCYDINIKCKMSKTLLGKVKLWYYLIKKKPSTHQ